MFFWAAIFPSWGHGRVPESPLDGSPALSEHLGIRHLAQGYFSGALKVSWHLTRPPAHLQDIS